MISLPGRSLLKLSAVTVATLFVILVIHQVSYTGDFALTNQSIEVVSHCDPSALEDSKTPREYLDSPIPNTVHQIWKNSNISTYPVHASHDAWKETMKPFNYTVKLWTDDDILELIKTNYTWLLSTYESYSQNIQRADVARLVVVHAEGGMYADLDVFPKSAKEFACLQNMGLQAIFAPTSGTLGLSNHFFMAARGAPFLEWALQEAKRRGGATSNRILLPYLRVFWSTGPIMVTHAFQQYSWMYNTVKHGSVLMDENYTRSVIGHAAGRSWHGSDGQFLNYVSDHLGVVLFWVAAFSSVAVLGLLVFVKRCRCKGIDLLGVCGSTSRSKERYIEV